MAAIIRTLIACALTLVAGCAATPQHTGKIDPTSVTYTEPADMKWVPNAAGTADTAILYGDPAKPGLYVVRYRWKAGNMSRPHFHPNDRLIVVLSGTWWVGTGEVFDPASTVPMHAGTQVLHIGKKIHYDGAKDGDAIIQIHGIGPATSTPAERKP
jgi:hypothetical protein